MVTAPHESAAQAGAGVLRDGGSAADGAVAMAASLAVVYPHMTGIGGDLFALYFDARSRQVAAYNGSGAAAAGADLHYYASRGMRAIPQRGPGAVLTVPGAVDGWFALHERFGRLGMPRLLAPAIDAARDGAPIARSVARGLEEERTLLLADEGGRAVFGDVGTRIGDALTQPALAQTLTAIADRGRDWFYRGAAAEAIDAYCRRIDSPLRGSDLAAHRGLWTEPLRARFHDAQSLTTAPNSQGMALLIAQQIYEEYAGSTPPVDCSADLVHGCVEATRIAYADRDRYVGDPDVEHPPLDRLLSREYARAAAATIDPRRAASGQPGVADAGGTTYFACVDADGNAASVIQSLYMHFGAAVVVPELGVVLQDRGCWFTLDEGNPRSLVGGRRPYHTLMANMLLRNGAPWIIYGSMGGDGQPQFGLALSIRMAERGMPPQAAVEAPRWRWSADPDSETGVVDIEGRADEECISGLRARGHRVRVAGDYEEFMGHAGAILVDRGRGVIEGGSDPRSDGAAIGA